ncbi:MAG: hypothetical protein IPL61_01075 [Myxococcales bacterium]|nr:hypothetical protein [Myxococcales bacterium]
MKWLALGGVVVLIGLLLVWRSLADGDAAATPAARPAPTPVPAVAARPAPHPDAPADDDHGPTPAIEVPEDPDPDAKIPLDSDDFYETIDRSYGYRLRGLAAGCEHAGKHRKAKVRILFRYHIAGGKVSVTDARIDESTLGDPKAEACMLKAVATAAWDDPRMPDWSTRVGEDERLLVRIEGLATFDRPEE